MREDAAKRLEANLAAPDVLVPVHARTQRRLRVIDVQDGDALAAPRCDRGQRWFAPAQPRCESRSRPQMRAPYPGKRPAAAPALGREWLATPRSASPPPNPFPPCSRAARASRPRVGCAVRSQQRRHPRNECLARLAAVLARPRESPLPERRRPPTRMHHQKIRAERQRANHLIVKRLNRPRPQDGIGRCQIHQIIRVDDQRPQPQFRAPRAKSLRVGLRDARPGARPHARTGRKNLQRVAAQLSSGFQRRGDVAGDGGVDAYACAAVAPERRLRLRRGFRPVFVLVVIRKCMSWLCVVHVSRAAGWQFIL